MMPPRPSRQPRAGILATRAGDELIIESEACLVCLPGVCVCYVVRVCEACAAYVARARACLCVQSRACVG